MIAEELQRAVRAAPFRPFEMVTGDGQRFGVPTGDHFSLSPSGRIATVWNDDDSHSIIDVIMITHLHYLPPGPTRKVRRKRK